jgi:DNA-binding MarR family transcriptional regulator
MVSASKRINQSQIQALAGFRNALRRFLAFSEEVTREEGLTAQQYQALLCIKAHPGGAIAIGELAKELLLVPSGAVQLVDRLSTMGLVERRPGSDKRTMTVALTDAGNTLFMRLASLHLGQLSKRKKQLADILRQVKQIPAS